MFKCFLLLAIFVSSCSNKSKYPLIQIDTGYGDILLELYPDKAPKTVAAFLNYVDSGYYENTHFYRVLKADELPNDHNTGIIQGGLYTGSLRTNSPGIEHESTRLTGLSHTDGTISLARTTPGSATTEFFICIGDQSPLDAGRRGTADSLGMAAFGRVIKGMDVVRKIQSQPSNGDAFEKKIKIRDIKRS